MTDLKLRLPKEHLSLWLKKRGLSWALIEEKRPCWPGSKGLVPLTPREIEWMIAREDPVIWGYLNLEEKQTIPDPETGEPCIIAGDPWRLFPVQVRMARLKGNTIFECGAEVGKTRDIVNGTLWEMDTCTPGDSSLVAADSDTTLEEIWNEIEFQLEKNPGIGGGVERTQLKPYKEKVFKRGTSFQMRLCGHDGKQFRGGHYNRTVRADEAAKWKNPQQWIELWRAAKPGCKFRIYSTPDGDYSSPFFAMCDRAPLVDGPDAKKKKPKGAEEEPKFHKLNISKRELPPPFWSETRAAEYRDQYGGESSVGWMTNVEGKWGSPTYSVFPMPTLRPNLVGGRDLPFYRLVVANVDREKSEVTFSAARLTYDLDLEEGRGQREEILARERVPLYSGLELGASIAAFFPEVEVAGWPDPTTYCGADLGSAQDPSEYVFVHRVGDLWLDVFRLHLSNADWPVQAAVVTHLDHAAGHRARYSFDNGSAGSALAQNLCQVEQYAHCPVCLCPVFFSERLVARDFGAKVTEIDVKTGQPKPDPDRKDVNGEPLPSRLSNKEFGTRILERKVQNAELRIAWDAGAGENKLSGPQLLVNHTASRSGERRFRGEDDHHVDARRLLALAIVGEMRDESVDLATAQTGSAMHREVSAEFASGGGLRSGLGFVRSGIRGAF